jgi:hypothetical protein
MNVLSMPLLAATFAAQHTSRASAASAATATPAKNPTETFTASTQQADLGILSPKQALAMKAQSKPAFTDKDLITNIAKHDYSNLVEQMSNMPGKRDFVAKFHKSHPAEYAVLVKDIREGKVTSPSLKVAVALNTLNGTKWAKTPEGAKVAAHLGKLYDTGMMTSMEDPGGLGRTDMTTENTGRDGSKSPSRVIVKDSLLNSPEAVATVLAHEGQHSYRASIGKMERALHEEVDAHATQNAVWAEFGAQKYVPGAQEKGGSLDMTAEYDTKQKLYNHLAATYTQDLVEKGSKADKAAARGIIVDYAEYSGQNGFTPTNNMHDDDLKSLLANAQSLLTSKSSDAYRDALDQLQVENSNRAENDPEYN